ncbi:hypothetical protein PUN28_010435 [Cardiocondyla obscurior]|uniref:Uncharacterized protein n=1 Tax=Cardiocondyla obscurior TaxID=286306 RepID=A0AAW2FGD8_9HYME
MLTQNYHNPYKKKKKNLIKSKKGRIIFHTQLVLTFIPFFVDFSSDDTEDKENVPDIDQDISEQDTSTNVLKALGIDPNDTKFKMIKYHPEMKNTWQKWKNEGLPDKNKKEILELYNRKADLYVEAPKLNLEIIPLFSEIAKKRDQHFVDTQNCVGTAITSLGTAVSMILDPPEEGIDEDTLTNYISHAGQILTDVFHQQSITRKSFITPQLNKNVKLVVENIFSDEWLYGDDLKEKVKDVKEIEKACANIKDKTPAKQKFRNQGNWRYPPANYRQVGYQYQKQRQIKFKRPYKSYQEPAKSTTQTMSQSSSKK